MSNQMLCAYQSFAVKKFSVYCLTSILTVIDLFNRKLKIQHMNNHFKFARYDDLYFVFAYIYSNLWPCGCVEWKHCLQYRFESSRVLKVVPATWILCMALILNGFVFLLYIADLSFHSCSVLQLAWHHEISLAIAR